MYEWIGSRVSLLKTLLHLSACSHFQRLEEAAEASPVSPAAILLDRFSLQANCAFTQPFPHLPLLAPVERFGDGSDIGLFDCVTVDS